MPVKGDLFLPPHAWFTQLQVETLCRETHLALAPRTRPQLRASLPPSETTTLTWYHRASAKQGYCRELHEDLYKEQLTASGCSRWPRSEKEERYGAVPSEGEAEEE